MGMEYWRNTEVRGGGEGGAKCWELKISSTVTLSTRSPYWRKLSHSISHVEKYEQKKKRKNVCYMKDEIADRPKCPKRDKTLFRNRTPYFIFVVCFLLLPQRVWRLCFVCVMVTITNVSRCVNCVCDEGTSGLLHVAEHFPEPRQFFFLYSTAEVFLLLCIQVELPAALGRLDTSVFSKFVFLELEV